MMKRFSGFLALAVFFLLLTGCPYGYKYDLGKFPTDPVNFHSINSIYDDYNSISPVIEEERYLYFSSNRKSSGGEFDIVGSNFRIHFDRETGNFNADDKHLGWRNYAYIDSLFARMNTGYNELGPNTLPWLTYAGNSYYYTDLIAYSNDETGKHDIKFVWFKGKGENPAPDDGSFHGPKAVSFLNSEADDLYLTFFGPGFFKYDFFAVVPGMITELLFCSNRGGNFDIYMTRVPSDQNIADFLGMDTTVTITPVNILNSSYNDKCPYTDGDLLVFASDRPGGYGGFDLYYSRRNGNTWAEPVNFGDKINTEYDEYRPIVARYYEFENELMIFSSNRPGGKGGFDLYYVGIPPMISGK